jgi:hypothetical protein
MSANGSVIALASAALALAALSAVPAAACPGGSVCPGGAASCAPSACIPSAGATLDTGSGVVGLMSFPAFGDLGGTGALLAAGADVIMVSFPVSGAGAGVSTDVTPGASVGSSSAVGNLTPRERLDQAKVRLQEAESELRAAESASRDLEQRLARAESEVEDTRKELSALRQTVGGTFAGIFVEPVLRDLERKLEKATELRSKLTEEANIRRPNLRLENAQRQVATAREEVSSAETALGIHEADSLGLDEVIL